jgi:hypothetical protein
MAPQSFVGPWPSQGRYLHTGQLDIHASSGILSHDSSVWAGEDS